MVVFLAIGWPSPAPVAAPQTDAVFGFSPELGEGLLPVEAQPDPDVLAQALRDAEDAPASVGIAVETPTLATADAFAAQLVALETGTAEPVFALRIRSTGALGMRLGLLIEQLPDGVTIGVVGIEEAPTATGADTINRLLALNHSAGDDSAQGRTWWSPLVHGAEATLLLRLPEGVDPTDVRVSIPRISHLFRTVMGEEATATWVTATAPGGDAAACQRNIICESSWTDAADAVAKMFITTDGGTYLCTGTLIEDLDSATAIPWLLTTAHCIPTQTAASTVQTYWFYESLLCSFDLPGSSQTRSNGAELIYTDATSENTLLRLNDTPPAGVAYLEWDPELPPEDIAVIGIHHPRGDLKKISFGNLEGYLACNDPGDGTRCESASSDEANHYWALWSQGIVETGSSGSALLNSSGQVIGTLNVGGGDCSDPKAFGAYGRFDVAYRSGLYQWLGGEGGTEPDFVIASITLDPSTPSAGQPFSATVRVQNLGDRGADAGQLRVWTDQDAVRACDADADAVMDVGVIDAGETIDLTFEGLTTSSGGEKTFRAFSDSGCETPESDEGNNQATWTYRVRALPDLTISELATSQSMARPGEEFLISATVRNSGGGPSGASTLRYFWSREPVIDPADAEMPGCAKSVDALAAAGTDSHQCRIHFNDGATLGTYYFGVCVDPVANETDTANNCSGSVVVTAIARATTYELTVATNGSGTLTTDAVGIDCGDDCNEVYAAGTEVTLTAKPTGGARFTGWEGACGGTQARCTLTVDRDTRVTASFTTAVPGRLKWSFQSGGVVNSSPALDADGTIYFGAGDYHLYALGPGGSLKWKTNLRSHIVGSGGIGSSPAIGGDGTVYVGMSKSLFALAPNDGQVLWQFETDFFVSVAPAIADDGTIYIGSQDNHLYAVNPDDGSRRWHHQLDGQVFGSPSIGPDGTVYVGTQPGRYFYAINPDGTQKWVFDNGGDGVVGEAAIGGDGTIYITNFAGDGHLQAINPQDGSLLWRHSLLAGSFNDAGSSIGSDGTIYATTWGAALYAVTPDRRELWNHRSSSFVQTTPANGAGGSLYIGTGDGYVRSLGRDGVVQWEYLTNDAIASSPVIAPDGTVYIGSDDGRLYAFESETSGPAQSPWPMFGHDAANTGNFNTGDPGSRLVVTRYGKGTVSSAPAGIECADRCSYDFDLGAPVTLTAIPAPNHRFVGWFGGECRGTGDCTLLMSESRSVIATFEVNQTQRFLNTAHYGDFQNHAKIVSDIDGIWCGSDCTEWYEPGTRVVLLPIADPGYELSMWLDDCLFSAVLEKESVLRTGSCQVTMGSNKFPEPFFTAAETTLYTLGTRRSGRGHVIGAGIHCGHIGYDCIERFSPGESTTITAEAADGYLFDGWDGPCAGSGPSCTLEMDENRLVTARFVPDPADYSQLTLSKRGGGTVTSTNGLRCGTLGGDCSRWLPVGETVILSASADDGFIFVGWQGGCSGTQSQCTLTMAESRSATALFATQQRHRVTPSAGPGGRVDPSVTQTVSAGGLASFAVTADSGFRRSDSVGGTCPAGAWSGDLWTTGPVDADCAVSFSFVADVLRYRLSVSVVGEGTVASDPVGILCGSDCVEDYDSGTEVVLTATAAEGYRFDAWSGPCVIEDGVCRVGMTSARAVEATFAANPQPPAVPDAPDATDGAYTDKVRVTWSTVPGATRYEVSRCNGTDLASCLFYYPATESPQDDDQGFAGVTYYYRVAACNDIGCSALSGYDTGYRAQPAGPDLVIYSFSLSASTVTYGERFTLNGTTRNRGASPSAATTLRYYLSTNSQISNQDEEVTDCADSVRALGANRIETNQCEIYFNTAQPTGTKRFGICVDTVADETDTTNNCSDAVAITLAELPTSVLTVSASVGGAVVSAPEAIDCPGTCSADIADGTAVELVARPAAGYRLVRWTGACSGRRATCTVTVERDLSVGAVFAESADIPPELMPSRGGWRALFYK